MSKNQPYSHAVLHDLTSSTISLLCLPGNEATPDVAFSLEIGQTEKTDSDWSLRSRTIPRAKAGACRNMPLFTSKWHCFVLCYVEGSAN